MRRGRYSHLLGLRVFFSRDFLRYLGPGFIVTVGFVDPGNWATNVAGGSEFGYTLLWVITLATLMLILFQGMSARLGIVTGHSLAYNVRKRFSRPWTTLFGGSVVMACVATDVAELLGGTERLATVGVQATARVVVGEPADGITTLARKLKADLIVMATHGHSEMRHVLVGSVTEDVVRQGDTPVLLVRPKAS